MTNEYDHYNSIRHTNYDSPGCWGTIRRVWPSCNGGNRILRHARSMVILLLIVVLLRPLPIVER